MALKNDLHELVEKGVISPEIAEKIENYYLSTYEKKDYRFTIFGVLGSLLVGLGIILIIAHNWDHFPKAVKVIFSFLPLLLSQLLVGYCILKEKSTAWKESSGVLLFFSVGACISLIAQVYNIPSDLDAFVMTWTLLCAPVVYILQSKSLVILHLVFATFYAIVSDLGYGESYNIWVYLLFLGLLVPFYIQLVQKDPFSNFVNLFYGLIPFSILFSLGPLLQDHGDFILLVYSCTLGLFVNLGYQLASQGYKPHQNGFLVIGSLGSFVVLLIASFEGAWEIQDFSSLHDFGFYMAMVLLLFSLVLVVYPKTNKEPRSFQMDALAPFVFTILFLIAPMNVLVSQIIANVFILLWGILLIYRGLKKVQFSTTNYGLFIIALLITCRFFDSNISFVVRGLLFLTVGFGFFAANYFMFKKVKQQS
jgi:uncharacterized membrane protein